MKALKVKKFAHGHGSSDIWACKSRDGLPLECNLLTTLGTANLEAPNSVHLKPATILLKYESKF